MSVHQEQLKMGQSGEEQAEQPSLEYHASGDDSLTAYWAAIGGAVLGTLLTLLVLAILNGGTIQFMDRERLTALEASLNGVDENVAAVNHNVTVLSQRLESLESQASAIPQLQENLDQVQASLAEVDQTLASQEMHLSELDEAVATLDVTRQQFNLFTSALAEALTEMGVVPAPAEEAPAEVPTEQAPAEAPSSAAPEKAAPAEQAPAEQAPATDEGSAAPAEPMSTTEAGPETKAEAPAAEAAAAESTPEEAATGESAAAESAAPESATAESASEESTSEARSVEETVADVEAAVMAATPPTIVTSPDVPANTVQVYFFADANENGVKDEDEASLVGLAVALTDAEGQVVASKVSNNDGAAFQELEPGVYTLTVEEDLGFQLASSDQVEITVPEDGEEGQIVYFPVRSQAGE